MSIESRTAVAVRPAVVSEKPPTHHPWARGYRTVYSVEFDSPRVAGVVGVLPDVGRSQARRHVARLRRAGYHPRIIITHAPWGV